MLTPWFLMPDKFWKRALKVGGLGTVGAFVVWRLLSKWLGLQIFSKLTAWQTFAVMVLFLLVAYAILATLVYAYLVIRNRPGSKNAELAFRLDDAWKGVNEVDCDRLIGPDVTNAINAMQITASSWLHNLVDRDIIVENHFEGFESLYNELNRCDRVVPGFEKAKRKCPDFISFEMKRAFEQMKAHRKKARK